ncbi:uncharacterized protein LY79DRAFT_362654 [Colletotrichum navitas]|uniref:Uncharacterized protein n=1 Tax=Colletotrichum navitas TaxID=681940 RepID=A0AAD8V0V0_9PEZI|nr:uncharacterized protein LY79DRAFT_362654 [Colletotrichum navitas]KAK1574693.1 hypothetical protein LY79DRAFT_362654 [Colletotrichum navitas]
MHRGPLNSPRRRAQRSSQNSADVPPPWTLVMEYGCTAEQPSLTRKELTTSWVAIRYVQRCVTTRPREFDRLRRRPSWKPPKFEGRLGPIASEGLTSPPRLHARLESRQAYEYRKSSSDGGHTEDTQQAFAAGASGRCMNFVRKPRQYKIRISAVQSTKREDSKRTEIPSDVCHVLELRRRLENVIKEAGLRTHEPFGGPLEVKTNVRWFREVQSRPAS